MLLMLLFMVSALAITLAISLPRTAMQSQRVKEETLIYRGEQYKRAVELYFRKHKKYPKDMDDLEETDGVRFLRRRYKDPITGEDEWRLIHMGPDGRFKDSLIYDQEKEEGGKNQAGGAQGGVWASTPIGSQPPPGTTPGFQPADGRFRGAERARAVRPSEAPAIPGQTQGGYYPAGAPGQEQDPNAIVSGDPNDPGSEGDEPGQPGEAGEPSAGQYPGYAQTLPSQIPPTVGQPGSRPQRGSRAARGAVGQQPPFGQAGYAAVPGAAAGGAPPAALGAQGVGTQASDLIRRLLTTPRPGGLAGLRGQQQGAGNQPAFSEGIAGVASKAEEQGVKVYQGRELYNEWEFVYDYRQDDQFGAGALGGLGGQGEGGGLQPAQPGTSASRTLRGTPGASLPGAEIGGAYPAGSQPPGAPLPGGVAPYPQPGAAPAYPAGTTPSPFGQGTRRSRRLSRQQRGIGGTTPAQDPSNPQPNPYGQPDGGNQPGGAEGQPGAPSSVPPAPPPPGQIPPGLFPPTTIQPVQPPPGEQQNQ